MLAAHDLAQRARDGEVLYDIAKFDERGQGAGSIAAWGRESDSSSRRQAEAWVCLPPSAISAALVVQAVRTKGQRGAKRQPGGGSPRAGGLPPVGTTSSASDIRSGKALRRPIV